MEDNQKRRRPKMKMTITKVTKWTRVDTGATWLVPICVGQASPLVQYLFSSIWTQPSRSYSKSAPKLVEQNEGTTYIQHSYIC